MAIEKSQEVHRPGDLKQSNKAHKHGRHRSKGSISIASKGKVSVKTISKKHRRELNREQRRHQALQIRQKKRDEVLLKKRTLGGLDESPIFVCVIPLRKDFDPSSAVSILKQCDPQSLVTDSPTGLTHITLPRFKQRFALVSPRLENELMVLDSIRACDTVLFMVSAIHGTNLDGEVVDAWGHRIILSSFAQGLPTPVIALTDLESVALKKRNEHKQSIQKQISKWFPEEKLMVLDKNSDAINIFRKIGNQKRKSLLYRDHRPYIFSDSVEYINEESKLKVSGYLRGTNLSVNGLVYLPGLGTFQMSQIDAPFDPYSTEKKSVSEASLVRVLERADSAAQESLQSEHVPDPMDAEQTWPTEEDLEMAKEDKKNQKVKKVPKGWSDYQAAWIPDDDAEFVSEASDEEDDSNYMDAISEERSEYSEAEEDFDAMTVSEIGINDHQYDQQLDLNAEQSDLEKLKAAKSDLAFPDEMDTPQDTPARVRFQKYRGLESFRTSPWDPKENLPTDYARIFQFQNFDHTRKRILKEIKENTNTLLGCYVTVHVNNVPELLWNAFKLSGAPLVLVGLIPHENKMSVMNVVLKRTNLSDEPIKSKEKLIFQCGYRRFTANPVFSQHTNSNKHKFERYFQPDATVVATFFAPILFPPAPLLCFKEVNNNLVLIATGSLLSCNPDRLIIKRAVLSGHPLKVHKKSAVVRFMFFNREDITYFKPCKLRTKCGRIGHIKEPLGTHGHMKCVFDGQLKSQDTVLLNLYKRVFPKWTYEDYIVHCENVDTNMEA